MAMSCAACSSPLKQSQHFNTSNIVWGRVYVPKILHIFGGAWHDKRLRATALKVVYETNKTNTV